MKQMETDFEPVRCPLCGADEFRPFVAAQDRLRVTATAFQLVSCNQCLLVYQNPRVMLGSIGKYYAGGYYASRPGRKEGSARSQARVKREFLKRKIIEEMGCTPGRLLDVGCANGDFLNEMKRNGWQAEGVEYSKEAAQYCQEHYDIKVTAGDLSTRPDDGAKFDLITMWGVLPHIPNPLPTIQHATKLLSERGRLVICCANIESYAFRLSRGLWGHLDQPRHYCMFSPRTLRRLLVDSGLIPGKIVHEGRLWKSEILFRPIGSMLRFLDGRPAGFFRSVALKVLRLVNSLLAAPVDAVARRLGRGAMMVVDARRR